MTVAIKRLFVTLALGLALAVALLWVLGGTRFFHVYAANLSVTTLDDELGGSGDCSLREAIQAANTDAAFGGCPAGAGADTILLGAGTYALTLSGSGEDGNASGDLDVTQTLTIAGLGPAQTAIDGSGLDRVLDVRPGAATVVISGVTILNGNVNDNGGGIHNSDARLTLINTVVLSNAAISGGGVYAMTGTVELIDSQVLSNTALSNGGGVCVDKHAAFTQTSGSLVAYNAGTNGGGVYIGGEPGSEGRFVLLGGHILSNTATHSGGGIYVYGNSATLIVTGSATVVHNAANGNTLIAGGGGIYVNTGSVTLGGGQVSTNTARYGGGVFVRSGNATLTMRGGEIRDNQAQDGGGIHVDEGRATVEAGQVAHNMASLDGGGAYVDVGQLTLSGGQIADNVAADDGGGVYVGVGQVTLEGGQVLSNTAVDVGGGVHVENGLAALSGTQVVGNLAPFGGGVFVDQGQVTVSAGEVSSNTAIYGGGGLCIYGGSATIGGGSIVSNTAAAGGGLFVYGAPVTLSGGAIWGNSAATYGGGVFLALPTSAFTQTGASTITLNIADNGGAVCALDGTTVLSGGLVLSNTAYTSGGGVFVYANTSRLEISGMQVLGNTAGDSGGGIYVYQGSAAISRAHIAHNRADDYGGGIFLFQGSVAVTAGQVTHNTVLHDGGGFYNLGGALTLVNATVSGNSATAGPGGALCAMGGTTVLTHTTVASNTAASGGGIYNGSLTSPPLLHNALLAHNDPANCDGTVDSKGYNLSDDGSCTLTPTDLTGVAALVGPLTQDGLALVHPLLPGSPAIDAGRCAPGITTDQRGQPRPHPVSPFCDIGAYEAEDTGRADLLITKVATPTVIAPGAPITFVLAFTNAGTGGATGVIVADILPVSITVHGVVSSGVVLAQTGPGYTWQVQDLLRGQTGAITLTASLTTGVPAGTLTNTAIITTATSDDLPGNNQSQVPVTVRDVVLYLIYLPLVLRGYP
jgi:CSLREA domain-containing protein/uncharacterized repeat protein (TIGR01451 family)